MTDRLGLNFIALNRRQQPPAPAQEPVSAPAATPLAPELADLFPQTQKPAAAWQMAFRDQGGTDGFGLSETLPAPATDATAPRGGLLGGLLSKLQTRLTELVTDEEEWRAPDEPEGLSRLSTQTFQHNLPVNPNNPFFISNPNRSA